MIPCGPSAMLLMSIAENAGVDQGPIAGYLAIAVSSPIYLQKTWVDYSPSMRLRPLWLFVVRWHSR